MGKELEYKLHIDSPAVLARVLADTELNALTDGPWMETAMKTTYFDGADRRFTARKWTLRHRFEGGESVVCLKTPQEERHTRGEWQVGAETVDAAAVAALLEAGAPQELRELYADGDVRPVCGAEFVRKHVMLRFPTEAGQSLQATTAFCAVRLKSCRSRSWSWSCMTGHRTRCLRRCEGSASCTDCMRSR